MTNEMAIRNLINNFGKLDIKLQKATILHFQNLIKENEKLKSEISSIDKKYENIINALSNRCFALTSGTMCLFCNFDCKFRKIAFKDDDIDPIKLMNIMPFEVDEALKDGRLKKDKTESSSTYTVEN